MKILPAVTDPPLSPRRRRHRPRPARNHLAFRECVRWEFGFTCAFCLVHAADLALRPARLRKGKPDWSIEHRIPQSTGSERSKAYANLYLSCIECNRSRSDRPLRTPQGRLLDPCRVGWGRRFSMNDFNLQLVDAADSDARYTKGAYDINAPEKVEMRRCREEAIRKSVEVLRRVPIALASQAVRSPQVEQLLLDRWQIARDLLRSYGALPQYAVEKCRCRKRRRFPLPRWLHRQCFDFPE